MSDPDDVSFDQVVEELERLGLDIHDLPGFAHSGSLAPLLLRLRAMQPGVTWHQVLPDLPKEFVPGRFETWPRRYAPFGPYDYPCLPAGPAIHIAFQGRHEPERFDVFVAEARAAGWPVYGAGPIPVSNPEWKTLDGFIILEHQTTEDDLAAFWKWVNAHNEPHVAAVPRNISSWQDYNC